MNILSELKGGEELKRELKKLEGDFIRTMAEELPREGELLKNAAQAQAPARSGKLRNSAEVTSDRTRGGKHVRVAVAYLDEKAAAVHEGVHWNHHVEGTRGFKWLERALNAFKQGFVQRIVEKLQGVVGRYSK